MSLFRVGENHNPNSPQQQYYQQPEQQLSALELTKIRGKKLGKWFIILYIVYACLMFILGIIADWSIGAILKGLFGSLIMWGGAFFCYLFVIYFGSFWIKD